MSSDPAPEIVEQQLFDVPPPRRPQRYSLSTQPTAETTTDSDDRWRVFTTTRGVDRLAHLLLATVEHGDSIGLSDALCGASGRALPTRGARLTACLGCLAARGNRNPQTQERRAQP